jgi:pyridoxal phosphate enzyme (YggS family)
MLTEKLEQVRARIIRACEQANRNPQDITLLAVSKFHSATDIRELAKAGQLDFGENYIQELLLKQKELAELGLRWHFIGPLQSNKCKEVACYADTLHSLDRVKLIEPLARYRPAHLPPLKICLQMNIDDEESKSGIKDWSELVSIAESVLDHKQLLLCGLMTIPKATLTQEAQRKPFAQLRSWRDQLEAQLNISLPVLSMGMSADLEAAIQEGATVVRVGTDIFGTRPQKANQN